MTSDYMGPDGLPEDVISDLVDLARAGRARPGTVAYVAGAMTGDGAAFEPPLPAALEARAMQRTRRALALQRWLFGLGLACLATGLSFRISNAGTGAPRFGLVVADHPLLLGPVVVAGFALLAAYAWLRRR